MPLRRGCHGEGQRDGRSGRRSHGLGNERRGDMVGRGGPSRGLAKGGGGHRWGGGGGGHGHQRQKDRQKKPPHHPTPPNRRVGGPPRPSHNFPVNSPPASSTVRAGSRPAAPNQDAI